MAGACVMQLTLSPVACLLLLLREQELKAALPPSIAHKADAASLIQQANPSASGKLTRKEFNEVLDKYFLA